MNKQVKTVLLTVLTLSIFTIALIELSGVSTKAIFNKQKPELDKHHEHDDSELPSKEERERQFKETVQRDSVMRTLPLTTIAFEESTIDFGKIKEGDVVKHTFVFENTGDNPLFISDVHSPCGCTVPTYSKSMVLPGKKGEITIEFNSKGKIGNNNRTLPIFANVDSLKTTVSFKAEVVEK